jgi:hypothetical protein
LNSFKKYVASFLAFFAILLGGEMIYDLLKHSTAFVDPGAVLAGPVLCALGLSYFWLSRKSN